MALRQAHMPPDCEGQDAPGFLVNWAARQFARHADKLLRVHGLSVAQLPPLLLLASQGPMLQRDLVRQGAIAQPAMVALLARLERSGLVERHSHGSDRRASLFSLTQAGRQAVAAAEPALAAGNAQALAGFSAEDAAALSKLLQRMIANLG